MLVLFGGLPGTGKTTISQAIAVRHGASYLRIDVIEQALRSAGVPAGDVGASGYIVGNAVAASNLANGRTVIVDCVNPVRESRRGWRATAARAKTSLIEIEIVCSDPIEHRRRVEQRASDIDGLALPSWQAVLDRECSPWHEPHVVIDTARLTPDEAVGLVERHMRAATCSAPASAAPPTGSGPYACSSASSASSAEASAKKRSRTSRA